MTEKQRQIKPILFIPKLPELYRKLLAEWLGTFYVVFVTACVNDLGVKSNQGALAVGFAVVMLVYTLGHISAFFNPAVTFAAYLNGFITKKELIAFSLTQYFGGWVGSLVVYGFEGNTNFPVDKPINDTAPEVFKAFVAELIGTTFLVVAGLQCGFSKQRGNQFFGFAIGMEVLSISYAVGKISGASLNPAMTTALIGTHAIAYSADPMKWWIFYMLAGYLASVVGAALFCAWDSYHPSDEVVFNSEDADNAEQKSREGYVEVFGVQNDANKQTISNQSMATMENSSQPNHSYM